jgi:hypothetical protein
MAFLTRAITQACGCDRFLKRAFPKRCAIFTPFGNFCSKPSDASSQALRIVVVVGLAFSDRQARIGCKVGRAKFHLGLVSDSEGSPSGLIVRRPLNGA